MGWTLAGCLDIIVARHAGAKGLRVVKFAGAHGPDRRAMTCGTVAGCRHVLRRFRGDGISACLMGAIVAGETCTNRSAMIHWLDYRCPRRVLVAVLASIQ